MQRCRDRSELGFERYVLLSIPGCNMHTPGRLLTAQQDRADKTQKPPEAAANDPILPAVSSDSPDGRSPRNRRLAFPWKPDTGAPQATLLTLISTAL